MILRWKRILKYYNNKICDIEEREKETYFSLFFLFEFMGGSMTMSTKNQAIKYTDDDTCVYKKRVACVVMDTS